MPEIGVCLYVRARKPARRLDGIDYLEPGRAPAAEEAAELVAEEHDAPQHRHVTRLLRNVGSWGEAEVADWRTPLNSVETDPLRSSAGPKSRSAAGLSPCAIVWVGAGGIDPKVEAQRSA
jgi:hypothetical protein